MPLIPLLPVFHRLNSEHFDCSLSDGMYPIVKVRWSDGRLTSTAGFYRRFFGLNNQRKCEIVLSRPILENLPKDAITSTLCHEMIHAWVDLILKIREGHGPNFRARMNLINSSQEEFHVSVRHSFPVPIKKARWWAVCPSCGFRFPYRRLVRGAACRKCCDSIYGGRWHSNCLLKYEPFLEEA